MLAPILKGRVECLCLSGAAALQIGLVTTGHPGWACPFKALFGIPCPGCGMSTSISQLLHGQWQAAFHTHAFAPIFFLGVIFTLIVTLLPEALRRSAIAWVDAVEHRTGLVAFLLIGLMLYWGLRLL